MTEFTPLIDYLRRVPSIDRRLGHGSEGERWWLKLVIDVRHPLAWRLVQELVHVLNRCHWKSASRRSSSRFLRLPT
jgi:hypothetical protein